MKTLLEKLFLLGCISLFVCLGCVGPHYSKHNVLVNGKPAPRIRGPHDPAIEANLTTNLWEKSPFAGRAGEVIVTPFKAAGVQGWKDFHLQAKAYGIAVQHEFSSNGFLTMDLQLQSLTVRNVLIPIHGTRYIRLEIYLGKVSVAAAVYERTNPLVVGQGKFVWDSDGWFEIHPQKTGDVQLATAVPTSRADQILTH